MATILRSLRALRMSTADGTTIAGTG